MVHHNNNVEILIIVESSWFDSLKSEVLLVMENWNGWMKFQSNWISGWNLIKIYSIQINKIELERKLWKIRSNSDKNKGRRERKEGKEEEKGNTIKNKKKNNGKWIGNYLNETKKKL